jgi:hypothetical protein
MRLAFRLIILLAFTFGWLAPFVASGVAGVASTSTTSTVSASR